MADAAQDDFFGTGAEEAEGRKWEFEEGDVLAGTVISIFEGDGDYGPYTGYVVAPMPEYTTEEGSSDAISEDDPLVWYVNENSAARRSIPRSGIAVGDQLRVDYDGEQEAKSGRTFKKFRVKVRSAVATSD